MSAFFDELRRRYGDVDAFLAQLKRRMKLAGITQSEIAAKSGFSRQHVSRWLGRGATKVPELRTMIILDETVERLERGL